MLPMWAAGLIGGTLAVILAPLFRLAWFLFKIAAVGFLVLVAIWYVTTPAAVHEAARIRSEQKVQERKVIQTNLVANIDLRYAVNEDGEVTWTMTNNGKINARVAIMRCTAKIDPAYVNPTRGDFFYREQSVRNLSVGRSLSGTVTSGTNVVLPETVACAMTFADQ